MLPQYSAFFLIVSYLHYNSFINVLPILVRISISNQIYKSQGDYYSVFFILTLRGRVSCVRGVIANDPKNLENIFEDFQDF